MLWPLSVLAQPLPALHNVVGVAANDVLNVRTGPGVQFEIVDELSPNATNIEVVSRSDNNWGLINVGEGSGWVSLKFMARQPGQKGFPKITSCYGTEPFWGLRISGQDLIYDDFDTAAERSGPVWRTGSSNLRGVFAFGAGPNTGVLKQEMCNDGMSDREFGLRLELLRGSGTTARLLSGCCSLN